MSCGCEPADGSRLRHLGGGGDGERDGMITLVARTHRRSLSLHHQLAQRRRARRDANFCSARANLLDRIIMNRRLASLSTVIDVPLLLLLFVGTTVVLFSPPTAASTECVWASGLLRCARNQSAVVGALVSLYEFDGIENASFCISILTV